MLDEHADCGATLNGYAASVVECDLEDFAAPGRAFRLLCSRSAALDGRGITRPRMPLELIVVACGAPKSRRRPSFLQKVIFGRRTSTTNTKE